jgi:hypothetical protein
MLGFSQISRLWSLKETCWRSRVIQVSKTHMDTCYCYFLYRSNILCIETCMFTTHMKCHFNTVKSILCKYVTNGKITK